MSINLIHCQRHAMATLFEVWLGGDDDEHLSAVGEAILDEVKRIEKLLSRFDPTAELARVNREAYHHPVLVDHELFAILLDCQSRCQQTRGYFDICRAARFPEAVRLQPNRTVRLLRPEAALDLGGYGKGYALDAAAAILQRFGVTSALLHGGTSSILAHGVRGPNQPWKIGIRNPFREDTEELTALRLNDCGFSCSATFSPDSPESDLVDPHTRESPAEQVACVVITPTAVEAEVLSTGLLAMGKPRAMRYLDEESTRLPRCSVLWIEEQANQPILEWLRGPSHEGLHD
jgi:thiamine biosynthesis lipoprotein